MATYKTVGIVLRRTNLGEADRIITFLTPDHGKVRAVARGVRRIKSRQAGHLELFCESELMLAHGKSLDVVASARLRWHPAGLAAQYEALTKAYLIVEMVDKLTDEGGGTSGLFEITRLALESLDSGVSPGRVEMWYRLRLLSELGYKPELDACQVCHQAGDGDYVFDVEHGGIAHRGCLAGGIVMPHGSIKVWRLCLSHSPVAISRLEGAQAAIDDGLAVADRFFDYLFGRRFKSSGMLGIQS